MNVTTGTGHLDAGERARHLDTITNATKGQAALNKPKTEVATMTTFSCFSRAEINIEFHTIRNVLIDFECLGATATTMMTTMVATSAPAASVNTRSYH